VLFGQPFEHGLKFSIKETRMNWDQISGQWTQLQGKPRSKWGKLTDDDWELIAGKKDQLLGKLRERYGYQKEQAEREVDTFINGLDRV
jgi:uncharacterized protein YjbJ (UPF0337 family)